MSFDTFVWFVSINSWSFFCYSTFFLIGFKWCIESILIVKVLIFLNKSFYTKKIILHPPIHVYTHTLICIHILFLYSVDLGGRDVTLQFSLIDFDSFYFLSLYLSNVSLYLH